MGIMDSSVAARQIPLDPKLPLHSVARLANPGAVFNHDSHVRHRHHKIPKPQAFRKEKSRELRKLRKSQVWKTGTRDEQVEQMAQWFPNLPPGGSTKGLSNPFLERGKVPYCFGGPDDGGIGGGSGRGGRDTSNYPLISPYRNHAAQHRAKRARFENDAEVPSVPKAPVAPRVETPPKSDLGMLGKLPGEIRNDIYRLAVLEEDKSACALIKLQSNTCAVGACLHMKATHCMPGIINTCKQIRHECAPIFFNENAGIAFDEGMVLQGCITNWIRTVGPYVNLVRQFAFKMLRPLHNDDKFIQWATYSISIDVAKYAKSGRFSTQQSVANTLAFNPPKDEICICPFKGWVKDMNLQWQYYLSKEAGVKLLGTVDDWYSLSLRPAKRHPFVQTLLHMVETEQFADFIWRLRKNKHNHAALKKCKSCKQVTFLS
ncbi:hypothetical protein Slin15195_G074120 [Septoria linicola]|uniref:Uncharacterized protein n=1 Tax=Septoria linicola TaxID=215465 RepID=A0A9Q9EM53_9PEZI|nr:hypothetical protein Slin15195_G074120 [Septoria linicola]